MRGSVQRAIGGYDPALPHSGDLEMWLRAAAVSDVGRVNGAAQAYYRIHPNSMQRTVHAGHLTDLEGRLLAFQSVLLSTEPGAPGRAAVRPGPPCPRLERPRLVRPGLRRGPAGRGALDDFVAFAERIYPEADRLREWRTLHRRRAAGPDRAAAACRSPVAGSCATSIIGSAGAVGVGVACDHRRQPEDLRQHPPLRRSAAWSTLDVMVGRGGQFAQGVVIARLLAPDDFGVFAVALVVHAIVINVSELGVSAALIRDDDDTVRRSAPTVATIAIVTSFVLGALMAVTAPLLARLLGSPRRPRPSRSWPSPCRSPASARCRPPCSAATSAWIASSWPTPRTWSSPPSRSSPSPWPAGARWPSPGPGCWVSC